MKTKKNKKFYNFTEKQKRRDRSRKMPRFWLSSVPSWYRRMFNTEQKAKSKEILHRVLKGEEIEFDKPVKNVAWYYW